MSSSAHARLGALAATILLVACGGADPTDPGSDPIEELPRALTATEQAVLADANAFGLALLAEQVDRDTRPNVVLSPLSASMALGMTMNGAAGETFDAMGATLGFADLEQEEINAAFRGLIDLLTTLDPEVRFGIANAVWANQDIPFHQTFFDAIAEAFDASATSSDFSDPATLEAINAWADEKTDGLIERILDDLDPDLVMILLNAIYLDAAWTTAFDPDDTRRRPFTRADGSTVEVEMMSLSETELPLASGPGWSAVELPYGGGAFSMVVVVPDGDVRSFVGGLDAAGWASVTDALAPVEVDEVAMPKFTLRYDAFLNEALESMGMGIAFDRDADFTRMSPIGDRLCIDFVRQKTFIEVDERGTRAAAVTAVGVGPESFTGVIVDRPFAFAIRERFSGTLLFVGTVGDPTYEDPGAEPFQGRCHG